MKWVAVLVMACLPAVVGPYGLSLLADIGIAGVAALGLVLLTGAAGTTSFGQAAFMGIGAYATAWWSLVQGGSPFVGLALAVAMSAAVAWVLGAATLRLGGHLLPLSTIAWGLAFFYFFGSVEALGRHAGMPGIPPVSVGGVALRSAATGYWLVWGVLGLALWLCGNLLGGRMGRAIRCLRGGAVLAESLGIDAFRLRLVVFVIAGVLAGVAGWLLAHVTRFISPSAFDVRAGMELLFMTMLGGAAEILGAVLGSGMVILARDGLQDLLPKLGAGAGQLDVVVFGAVFILLLQYARGGVLGWLPVRRGWVDVDGTGLARRAMPAVGADVLVAEGVTKRFGGLVAVDGMGVAVRAGEILALIGPNGAGKSTLFDLLSGGARPDGGVVRCLGREVTGLPARGMARLGVARTFQHVRLRADMSVLENVMLGAHLRLRAGFWRGALRLDRAEERSARGAAMTALGQVGLEDAAGRRAGDLALGQQRLVEIARALAADPVVVLLDEPAAGLRAGEKTALAGLLRDVRDAGVGVLLVEHDMGFVMGVADRVVVMAAGVGIAAGAPEVVRRDVGVQEAYLGVG